MADKRIRRTASAILLLIAGYFTPAQATVEGEAPGSTPAVREHSRFQAHAQSSLEGRIRLLARELDLDPDQQTSLRSVLETQRDQVKKVWDNNAVPADIRIAATQAISDQIMDQIRALLTEEQRKKFAPPRPSQNVKSNSARASVDAWMDATRPKPAVEH